VRRSRHRAAKRVRMHVRTKTVFDTKNCAARRSRG
jgi:hypothetical protein